MTEQQRLKNAEAQRRWRLKNPEKVKQNVKEMKKRKQTNPVTFVKSLITASRSSAKTRGIPFKLTYDIVYDKIVSTQGKCSLSGLQMDIRTHSPMRVSIDRIDSDKGYTKDNIQIVASCVNISKNDLTMEQFITLCKAVAKRNKV